MPKPTMVAVGRGNGKTLRLRPAVFLAYHDKLPPDTAVHITERVEPGECAHTWLEWEVRGEFVRAVCPNCGTRGPEMLTFEHAERAFRARQEES